MTEKFDYEQDLADIKAGKPLTGKDSILSPLIKQLTEAALEAEIDTHLAKEVAANQWLEEYNTIRPHGSLCGMSPEKFLQCWSEVNTNQQPETLTG